MSFSAQTCITNTGTTQLGPTLYFYSNVNGYQGSFGNESTVNLIGDNCPYIMENIPDETTIVRIIDPITNCCVDINLQSSNLCQNCNLSFDVYETQTVSQIVAGNLISSCGVITDYIIHWYGPGINSTNLARTSGKGTYFADIGYELTHPLTGNASPIIEAGTYTPVIYRLLLNGTVFSPTGGSGTYQVNLNCFNQVQVNVDPIRCGNGNLPSGSDYSHSYSFSNNSVGVTPQGLSASFELLSTTNYIAWKFKGYDVYDTIKMTFYGSAYEMPLIIENLRLGDNAGNTDISIQANPKTFPSEDFVRKVTCLTGLTVNEGDYITINITPNPEIANTIWDLQLKCLENFNCSTCFDQYQNNFTKIISAQTTVTLLECDRMQISLLTTGCTLNDFYLTDTGKYLASFNPIGLNYNSAILSSAQIITNPMGLATPFCIFQSNVNHPINCSTPSQNTYTFSKTNLDSGQGLISFEFQELSDLNFYYSKYLTVINSMNASSNSANINYYKYFLLFIPNNSDPNQICGDGTPTLSFNIHHTSVVTTGDTGPYTMTMTMPTIVNNINFTSCDLNCQNYIDSIVNSVNSSSLSSVNNIIMTTNTGSKYQYAMGNYYSVNLSQGNNLTAQTVGSQILKTNWTFQNETYVYSADNFNNLIFINSLSGKTCENRGNCNYLSSSIGTICYIYSSSYKVELTDLNNLSSFNVLVSSVSNYVTNFSNFPNTAMTVVNGVITYANPDYCI